MPASALAPPAQHEAARLYGFNETHTSILRSAVVAETLNTLLAGVAR